MKKLGFFSLLLVCPWGYAQDPTGVLEGQVFDPANAVVTQAVVTAQNAQTGFVATQQSGKDGSFHFSSLPVGDYELRVAAEGFAPFTVAGIHIDIDRTVRFPANLVIAGGRSEVNVTASGVTADLNTAIGHFADGHGSATQWPQLHPARSAATRSRTDDRGAFRSGRPAAQWAGLCGQWPAA
jgi:hypothetical protein